MLKKVTVKITAPMFAGYTGPLGGYLFKDGVSVDPIPLRNALRIGATIEAVDENDVQLSPSTYPVGVNLGAVEAVTQNLQTEAAVQAEYVPETSTAEASTIDITPERIVREDGTVVVTYSQAQLEAIADKRGINGLREIGDALGVKGRSMAELITNITVAQSGKPVIGEQA
jgi:hypothetical protein